jgi:hypothetical protein
MKFLRAIAVELIAMFAGDSRLTIGVFAIVAAAGLLIGVAALEPLTGAGLLLVGCLILLIENVRRSAAAR